MTSALARRLATVRELAEMLDEDAQVVTLEEAGLAQLPTVDDSEHPSIPDPPGWTFDFACVRRVIQYTDSV